MELFALPSAVVICGVIWAILILHPKWREIILKIKNGAGYFIESEKWRAANLVPN